MVNAAKMTYGILFTASALMLLTVIRAIGGVGLGLGLQSAKVRLAITIVTDGQFVLELETYSQ